MLVRVIRQFSVGQIDDSSVLVRLIRQFNVGQSDKTVQCWS